MILITKIPVIMIKTIISKIRIPIIVTKAILKNNYDSDDNSNNNKSTNDKNNNEP